MKVANKKASKFLPVIIVCLLSVVIALGAVAGINSTSDGTALAADEFVSENSVTIAQITDMHYYSHALCNDSADEDSAYTNKVRTGTKLVVESAAINIAALEDIKAQNPDVLFCTGDMTMNGEIQGHMELGNLLRQLQNDIRANGNPDFQVFVIMGNHDMYNGEAYDYRTGEAVLCDNFTRVDVTKAYASLGFPDLTDEEIGEYYDSLNNVYNDRVPYRADAIDGYSPVKGIPYVNSTLSDAYEWTWLYKENGQEEKLLNGEIEDYDHGDFSYIAYHKTKAFTVLATDDECSIEETQHHLGGLLFDNVREFYTEAKDNGLLGADSGNKNRRIVVTLAHHNALPHFIGEDSLLKDFTFYNTFETADIYADLGIRYMFSGHMHANDVNSRISLNGNYFTDTETASATGYKGAVRYSVIEQGKVGSDYAENYSSRLDLISEADLTSARDNGLIPDGYFEANNLGQYITEKDGKLLINDCSEYSVTKLFRNIIQNMIMPYVSVDFIGGAGDFVAGILPDSINIGFTLDLTKMKGSIGSMVDNLVRHIEVVGLEDYVYAGDNAEFQGTAHGQKLCGYLDELIDAVLNMPVNSQNDTLFDFALGCYLDHVGGTDTTWEDATDGTREALEKFLDGSNVEALLNLLLDEETGLMRIVKCLFEPIDLGYGMTDDELSSFSTLLSLVAPKDKKIDMHAFVIDDILPNVMSFLSSLGINFDMKGLGGAEFIDDVLDSYVTDAFYTSLGQIAYDILGNMTIDESADIDNNFETYSNYKHDRTLPATYVEGKMDNTPTAERGMLPNKITVTFGEDPTTDKNITWITDKSITGTDIEYCVGETFNAEDAVKGSGDYVKMLTTTANIDLSIYATLMHVQIGKHTVELTGLEPDTTYSYRVGSAALGYWSDVYTFKTAPADDADFEILLISDIQGSAQKPYAQAKKIMDNIESVFTDGYDFIINCGDIVDNSRNLVQWNYYFDNLLDVWGNSTVVVTAGNHDKYTYEQPDYSDLKESIEYSWVDEDAVQTGYNYLFNYYNVSHVAQDTSKGVYYSFDYSGVHFTVLNTNDLTDAGSLSDAQTEWLLDDLASTDKEYKVVVMHKGIYSSGSHISDTDVKALRKQLTSVFAENGVALVLSGHDHTYSESYYIDANGEVVENSLTGKAEVGTGNGVLYITLGTFGDKFYDYVESDDIPLEFGKKLHNTALDNPTFGKLVYEDGKLYYYGYQYNTETDQITNVRGGLDTQTAIIVVACTAVGVTALAIALGVATKRRKRG